MTDTDSAAAAAKVPARQVGIWLAIGILILPYIFAWLTLRKGHSALTRWVSFGWLALLLVAILMPPTP